MESAGSADANSSNVLSIALRELDRLYTSIAFAASRHYAETGNDVARWLRGWLTREGREIKEEIAANIRQADPREWGEIVMAIQAAEELLTLPTGCTHESEENNRLEWAREVLLSLRHAFRTKTRACR